MGARPLSPHLGHYRFMYTMATSIFHRATGMVMTVGLVLLVSWLMAMANGEQRYMAAVALFSTWFFKLVLFGVLAAFLYHFANGIRHLCWDLLLGLEKHQARRSALFVAVFFVVALAVFTWALFFRTAGVA
ncbi:MAG: succinate dehydrogenase, cytochrome b556 subunit [Steroidobacteraceae bacterium]